MADNLTEVITWIPVGERLPKLRGLENPTPVLARTSLLANVELAVHDGKLWRRAGPLGAQLPGVTHWAELPRGPHP